MIHSGGDARFLLLGGRMVGGETLLRFYVLHCVALPLAAAVLIAVHFWRVRKDGGISGAL
jgi:quinol-cytochrome oxidoreductase complex cytochrome b subunit